MTETSASPKGYRPHLVRRVITHLQPHLDEGVAYYIATRYGVYKFPGMIEAELVFVDAGTLDMPGNPHDYVALGVSRGIYNEHPIPGRDRIKDKSCALLMAESLIIQEGRLKGLPVSELPELKELLAYTNNEDLTGDGGPKYNLADTVKALNEAHPNEPDYVMDVMTSLIDAYVQRARKFHKGGRNASRHARVVELEQLSRKSLPLKLAVIETDKDQAKSYAFSKEGGYKAAVIQQNSNGQVQIFVKEKNGLDLNPVAAAIRIAEIEAAGGSCSLTDEALVAEGTNPAADRWHYFPQGNCLLNGSRTSPDTEPTRLELEEIVEIFVKHVCRKQSA